MLGELLYSILLLYRNYIGGKTMAKEVLVAKQAIVDEVAEKLNNSASVVVAEYRGLTVAEVTELRTALRAEDVEMKVYKNKLVKRATEAAGMSELDEFLSGPNALVFGHSDAVAPARVLAKFAKDHEALVLKAGIVEGKMCDEAEIKALSKLPSREGMYSMLLACLKDPTAKVARVVKALADKKSEGEAAPVETAEAASEEAAA
ncbi:50S ribosomal protein L10 [Kandleria vitulina DSM 20405]|uniref:Large ribosomal subunit protein uL10 n=2 Tax=Kandleria vitulina TaxID=1630 RepID=A0A0R2HE46_9FIRM|nr:50S ribosomal protein L10 [Kandleria vitulina DSM 20405]